jgi:S-DNA-T family DNA segregation ATPase FtsK/SpoIIIE
MQLLWFLPSIAYGVIFAVTSGNYLLLASTLLSAVAMLLVRWRMSRQPKLNEQTKLLILGDRIWLDDYRLPRGSAFWSREQFDFVFERMQQQSDTLSLHCEQFASRSFSATRGKVPIGFDANGIFEISLKSDGPHAIVVGATGSGKTELLKHLVRGLLHLKTEVVLIDFKGGSGLGEYEAQSKWFITDQDLSHANQLFTWLEMELRDRSTHEAHQDLVIVVDELAHLLTEVAGAEKALASIAARGRSAKMHLVLANQNLVGVPRALLSNLKLRILVGQHDPVDAALLGQPAKSQPSPSLEYRVTSAQQVSHGAAARQFWFTASRPERLPAPPQVASEPAPLPSWSTDHRKYSSRGLATRRRGRHRANRDWPPHARKAGLHWLARR